MFNEYFDYLFSNNKINIIFAHNLGSFDGRYIFKYLSLYSKNNPLDVTTCIDLTNKFVSITKTKVVSKNTKNKFTKKISGVSP
jgi:hypothetical protein